MRTLDTTGVNVTLADPDQPLDVIYDGAADAAHERLIPGIYPALIATADDDVPATLTVLDGASILQVA